ncbi:RHS repeat domain-containing protein [Gilliamella sp. N-G2]|uniref:RHS repeat domain-containing protein n=1 Tax=unclassified Gilliamella TaxID=2685620 RepID=UPI0035281EB8
MQHKLMFQGQYLDRKIGLHYNTFRYCDRDIGRFIQPDLIGFLVGINLYQFDRLGLMHGEVIVLSIL